MNTTAATRTLQVGVKAMIRDEQGRLLLIRKDRPLEDYKEVLWELPGGRINPGEPTIDGLRREVCEETGLEVVTIDRLVAAQDILANPELHVVRLTYEVTVTGTITLNHSDTSDTTHDRFGWFSKDEIAGLVIDRYFTQVLADLKEQ